MHFRLIFFLCIACKISAAAQNDSLVVFSIDDLFYYIKQFHPVAKQAELITQKGNYEILKAKGKLDPSLFSDANKKELNSRQYYEVFSGGIKIPTWYGLDIKAGYDFNQGINVNPENKTSGNGLAFAGISAPLGQGLFIDERRAAIKEAEIYAKATLSEQKLLLNNLFYKASVSYWKWTNAYNQKLLYEKAVELARERFIAIKQSFIGGDVPAIDTLEAYIQVQVREVNYSNSSNLYINSALELSTYLWADSNIPLEITDKLVPVLTDTLTENGKLKADSLFSIINNLHLYHPQLLLYNYKLKQLEIEKKWNIETFKPKINLNYNLINEPIQGDAFSGISQNNYKFGFDFSFPVLLRNARGNLNLTKIKMLETEYEIQFKQLEIANKIKAFNNELIALEEQIKIFLNATQNYFLLLEAEKQKFFAGESSVFLINSRENAYIQASLNLIDMKTKYQRTIAELRQVTTIWQ